MSTSGRPTPPMGNLASTRTKRRMSNGKFALTVISVAAVILLGMLAYRFNWLGFNAMVSSTKTYLFAANNDSPPKPPKNEKPRLYKTPATVTIPTDSLAKVSASLKELGQSLAEMRGQLANNQAAMTARLNAANARADSLAKVNATLAEKVKARREYDRAQLVLSPKLERALEQLAQNNPKPAATTTVAEHHSLPTTPPVHTTVVTTAGYTSKAPQATMTMKEVVTTPWVPAKATGTSQFSGKPDLLGDYDGDMYGEVSSKDPWDLQYDAATASWMLCIYINAPEEVAWMTDATPTAPYIYCLGCLRNVQQDPVGQLIGASCVEFSFKSSGIVRVNLPIRVGSPTSVPVGWGWILPSSCTVDGSNNGYRFDLSAQGSPKRVAATP